MLWKRFAVDAGHLPLYRGLNITNEVLNADILVIPRHSLGGGARATTIVSQSPAEQIGRASVAVEATVASVSYGVVQADGEELPLTYYLLDLHDILLGDVASGQLRLVVPGGFIGDQAVEVVSAPVLTAGDRILALGNRLGEDIILTGWTQTLFIQRDLADPYAVDSEAHLIAGFGCDEAPWVALPLSDAPSAVYDGVAMTEDEAVSVPGGPVFVAEPERWGMRWTDVVSTYRACILASANPGEQLAGYGAAVTP